MFANICGFVFKFNVINKDYFNKVFEKYLTNSTEYDYLINVFENEKFENPVNITYSTTHSTYLETLDELIQYQREDETKEYFAKVVYKNNTANIYFKNEVTFMKEYLLLQYVFSYFMTNDKDQIFIHGSSILYKDSAILFSAPSGTGKSTHARLWVNHAGAININDDKNIIRKVDDKLMVIGNPFSGKHHLDNNVEAPLKAIVFLYQSKENVLKRLKPIEAFNFILKQIKMPANKKEAKTWNEITTLMLNIPIYYYGCNMEIDALNVIKDSLEEIL